MAFIGFDQRRGGLATVLVDERAARLEAATDGQTAEIRYGTGNDVESSLVGIELGD